MKRLITILFLFSFALNAQEKKFDWEHPIGGAVVAEIFYWPAYAVSNDEDFSFRFASIFGTGLSATKECFDVLIVENGEFSWVDAGKSTVAAISTAYLNKLLCKWIKNRKSKRKKYIPVYDEWVLENEFLNNKQ